MSRRGRNERYDGDKPNLLRRAASLGSITLLGLAGLFFLAEGDAALTQGSSNPAVYTPLGLDYAPPWADHVTRIYVGDAPPSQEAGGYLLLSALAFASIGAAARLAQEQPDI